MGTLTISTQPYKRAVMYVDLLRTAGYHYAIGDIGPSYITRPPRPFTSIVQGKKSLILRLCQIHDLIEAWGRKACSSTKYKDKEKMISTLSSIFQMKNKTLITLKT